MKALLTTCTAEKDPAPGLLPAQRRYRGARIDAAVARAAREGLPLLFLSGALGVVAGDAPIHWYDRALADCDVDGMVEQVAAQLRALGISNVVALLAPVGTPGWAPYRRLLAAGCAQAGVALAIEEVPGGWG